MLRLLVTIYVIAILIVSLDNNAYAREHKLEVIESYIASVLVANDQPLMSVIKIINIMEHSPKFAQDIVRYVVKAKPGLSGVLISKIHDRLPYLAVILTKTAIDTLKKMATPDAKMAIKQIIKALGPAAGNRRSSAGKRVIIEPTELLENPNQISVN